MVNREFKLITREIGRMIRATFEIGLTINRLAGEFQNTRQSRLKIMVLILE